MLNIKLFDSAIEQICEERGISKERVLESVETALAAAYKRDYGRKGQNIKVKLNPQTGQLKVFQVKLVVDQSMLRPEEKLTEEKPPGAKETTEPEELTESEEEKKIKFNPDKHILIEEAKKLKEIPSKTLKKLKPGDELEFPLTVHEEFGRIAAQTAKQVIIQKIREAEREAIFDEYKQKEGQIISGVVQRIEGRNVFLDIGKTSGILYPEDQIPNEHYHIGQRLRLYITEVKKETREPAIILSRSHPEMVSQLFSLEVPEIAAGTVEIKSIAREAGSRSKIAVVSHDEKVDPIGSMIGQKGSRVQTVINELAGEKIDIIEWSEDPTEFISHALSPAKILEVQLDEEKQEAKIIVPPDQVSLAIGIKGQNVRLAAKLTNWKLDILPLTEKEEKSKPVKKKTTKEKKAKKTNKKKQKAGKE